MAVLRAGDLALEVTYSGFEGGWVCYDITPTWRGKPILNDAILKRDPAYWASRGVGVIKAGESEACGILPLIKRVLATGEPDEWEALDPDISLAINVGDWFPLVSAKRRGNDASKTESALEPSADEAPEREAGRLDTADFLEVVLCVDIYNFEGAKAYGGDGVCFRLTVTPADLQRFYEDLRAEYVRFRATFDVDAYHTFDHGPNYQPPEF